MGKQARLKAARRPIERARRDLAATGLPDRLRRAQNALRAPAFLSLMSAAIKRTEDVEPVKRMEQVRAIAAGVLEKGFGCDMAGVELTFAWDPATKKLDVFCRPSHAEVAPLAAAKRQTDRLKGGIESRPRTWRALA
jgi:hypothetical protein